MPGHYLLFTDGGMRSDGQRRPEDPPGEAAIGVVLKKRRNGRLIVVDYISRTIGHEPIDVAEYQALIEGLRLARHHGIKQLRVYVDSEFVVKQVTKGSRVNKAHLKSLNAEARALVEEWGRNITVSWVPREMNNEADQRVNDALLRRGESASS